MIRSASGGRLGWTMESVTYLYEPYLVAHSVNVFAGRSGAGKTHFLMQMIAEYKDWLPPILYLAADQPASQYTPIREKYGLDDSNIQFYSRIDEMAKLSSEKAEAEFFSAQGSFRWMQRMAARHPECRLVICDPGQSFVPTARLNDQTSVIGGMGILCRWAIRHEVTIVNTWHTNKRTDDIHDVFDQLSGSHAVLGHTSSKAILIAPSPNRAAPTDNHILYVRGKSFPDTTLELERNPTDGKFKILPAFSSTTMAVYARIPAGGADFSTISSWGICSDRQLYRVLDQLVRDHMLEMTKVGSARVYTKYVSS